ncbi:MAG: DUF512 domain-containing protein [Ruminococcaceae bacterium]|nr:DUF512 domain-containing protein [Oscillospiraceae bacterium]
MVSIIAVCKGSYADRAGILPGDKLVSVNGNTINDVLDYRFYIMDKRLNIVISREDIELSFDIVKPEYDDIGLEFATYLMDEKKRCRNNCIFCFIDQNPMGMRETIYFKDDDERLSFLMGNYVTLTNLKESDIERIIKMRISPVNISVHTTDPELRVMMMRNRYAGDCLRYIEMLDKGGISINAQLVLCKGINDGEYLKKSLSDLLSLQNIESIALVPCGLTAHRAGLYDLEPFDKETASEVIRIADAAGEKSLRERGMRLVYASDEFYLLSETEIPSGDYYEGYPQLENGVGMIRSDSDEFYECLANLPDLEYNRRVSIATGYAAYDFIKGLASAANEKFQKLSVNVFPIRNDFFGGSVTVSGLVTGGDIIAQLRGRDLGDELLIPENMLRAEGDMFLDNVTLESLSTELSVPVRVVARGGFELCEAMTGMLCEL